MRPMAHNAQFKKNPFDSGSSDSVYHISALMYTCYFIRVEKSSIMPKRTLPDGSVLFV